MLSRRSVGKRASSKSSPQISARSTPRRSSDSRTPRDVSHTRRSVPRSDDVRRCEPVAEHASEDSGCVCASRIGERKVFAESDPALARWISCTCPGCRPGRARRVEPGVVESAERPESSQYVMKCTEIYMLQEIQPSSAPTLTISILRRLPLANLPDLRVKLVRERAPEEHDNDRAVSHRNASNPFPGGQLQLSQAKAS
jgi:hypothetical protein